MVVNLGSKKGETNNNSFSRLTRLYISLLMRTVDTPEKDLSDIDW